MAARGDPVRPIDAVARWSAMNKALVRAFVDLPNDHPVILDDDGLIHATPRSHSMYGKYTLTTVVAALVYGRTTCPYCWRRQP
jgi:hypothetical protein